MGELQPSIVADDLLRRVVDTVPAFLHSFDCSGNLGFSNQRWLDYPALNEEDLRGWGWTRFIHPEDTDGVVAVGVPALASGEAFQRESRARGTAGQICGFCIGLFPSETMRERS